MTLDAEGLLSAVAGYTQAERRRRPTAADRSTRLAVVDYAYDPEQAQPGAGVRVQFDGEQQPTGRAWPLADGCRPRAGDRVVMLPVGRQGWVVLCTVGAGGSARRGWQPYTPVWETAGATAPAVGNGSLTGRWVVEEHGTVHFGIELITGTTTTFGTGTWRFSLPLLPASSLGMTLPAPARITATGGNWAGAGEISSGDAWVRFIAAGTGNVNATTPGAWSSGHYLRLTGAYPAGEGA